MNNTLGNTRYILDEIKKVAGKANVITSKSRTKFYRTGFRVGEGNCLAVVLPENLLDMWSILQLCVKHDLIVQMQAANTGVNGGSTPFGEGYDRDIVIINTLKIKDIYLFGQGEQALALAGATLFDLEKILNPLDRGPHSVIGSSCIGASIIGGICNNSGGNLVNRGPAYTELSLYAQIDEKGGLVLVNHLGIELGDKPEEILKRLQQGKFNQKDLVLNGQASDTEYQQRVRDTQAETPARFNADKRRLYESSGCAGKLAVFAVILDTFPNPKQEQVFYVGSNDPDLFTHLRKQILENFKHLPEMGEYMHRGFWDGADRYGKDTFLTIKYLGTPFFPQLFKFKGLFNALLQKIPVMPNYPVDRLLQRVSEWLPDHLPKRLRQYRDAYEHHLIIKAVDESILETRDMLHKYVEKNGNHDFFECTKKEGEAALLHRFVAGGAGVRYAQLNADKVGGILPLDIALPRNETRWYDLYDDEILEQIDTAFCLSHFLCMVFHHDFVIKKGVDAETLKKKMLSRLNDRGAKYPAEHNVGHLYHAEEDLIHHYQCCDPTNSMNPGIGKTSKKKYYA